MQIIGDARQTREAIAVLVRELSLAEQSSGSAVGSFDEVLLHLDLDDPPTGLEVIAELLNILQNGICTKGDWTPATYPLGPMQLRELIIGQLLDYLSQQLEVLRDAFLLRAGIDLESLEMLLPRGDEPST